MESCKKWLSIIGLVIVLIVLGLNMWSMAELYIKSSNTNNYQTTPKPKKKIKTIESDAITKKILKADISKKEILEISNWIYRNNSRIDKLTAVKYADFIYRNTKHPYLIIAVISKESNFKPCSRSSVGAIGLGQIRPEMWVGELNYIGVFEAKDLYNWRLNVLSVDHILKKLLKRFDNNIDKVLKYYVGGNHAKYINSVKNIVKELVIQKG